MNKDDIGEEVSVTKQIETFIAANVSSDSGTNGYGPPKKRRRLIDIPIATGKSDGTGLGYYQQEKGLFSGSKERCDKVHSVPLLSHLESFSQSDGMDNDKVISNGNQFDNNIQGRIVFPKLKGRLIPNNCNGNTDGATGSLAPLCPPTSASFVGAHATKITSAETNLSETFSDAAYSPQHTDRTDQTEASTLASTDGLNVSPLLCTSAIHLKNGDLPKIFNLKYPATVPDETGEAKHEATMKQEEKTAPFESKQNSERGLRWTSLKKLETNMNFDAPLLPRHRKKNATQPFAAAYVKKAASPRKTKKVVAEDTLKKDASTTATSIATTTTPIQQQQIISAPDAHLKKTGPVESLSDSVADVSEIAAYRQTLLNKISVLSRISVFWAGENDFYAATVLKVRKHRRRPFYVEYDDGDAEWLDLSQETFRLLKKKKKKKEQPPMKAFGLADTGVDSSAESKIANKELYKHVSLEANVDASKILPCRYSETELDRTALKGELDSILPAAVSVRSTKDESIPRAAKLEPKSVSKTSLSALKKKARAEVSVSEPTHTDKLPLQKLSAEKEWELLAIRAKKSVEYKDNFAFAVVPKRAAAKAAETKHGSAISAVRSEQKHLKTRLDHQRPLKKNQVTDKSTPKISAEKEWELLAMSAKNAVQNKDYLALSVVPKRGAAKAAETKFAKGYVEIRKDPEAPKRKYTKSVKTNGKEKLERKKVGSNKTLLANDRETASLARKNFISDTLLGHMVGYDGKADGVKRKKSAAKVRLRLSKGSVMPCIERKDSTISHRSCASSAASSCVAEGSCSHNLSDSETDEGEINDWAAKMVGVQPSPVARHKTLSPACGIDEPMMYVDELSGRRHSDAHTDVSVHPKKMFKRSNFQPEDEEATKREREGKRPMTTEEVAAILAVKDSSSCDDSQFVRRSMRQPSKAALNSPGVKTLVAMLLNNDPEVKVLKMKKYVQDPATPVVVIDAVLDALAENHNCEALYIQVSFDVIY
jgi:hypothetical protein